MNSQLIKRVAVTAIALALPGLASAFTVYDDVGPFEDATWGGSGIPNDAVASSKQFIHGGDVLRIALSATPRYSNPAVGNNGAGIYEAQAGSNCGVTSGTCPGSGSIGALWNFNYFVDIAGGNVLADYQIDLYYDLNPAGPTAFGDLSGLGKWDLTASLLADPATAGNTLTEDSQNLNFGFLATGTPFIDAPGGVFNADANGNYQFALVVSRNGFPIDSAAIEVNVVPIPAAVWMFGSALGLLGWMRRKA